MNANDVIDYVLAEWPLSEKQAALKVIADTGRKMLRGASGLGWRKPQLLLENTGTKAVKGVPDNLINATHGRGGSGALLPSTVSVPLPGASAATTAAPAAKAVDAAGAAAKTVGTPAAGGGRSFMEGLKKYIRENPKRSLQAAGSAGVLGGYGLGNWRGNSTGMAEGIAQGTKDTEKTMMKGFQEQLANLKAKEDSIGFLGRLLGSRVFS